MADTYSTLTRSLLIVAVITSAACSSVTGPSSLAQQPVALSLAGQSNARLSRPALTSNPDIHLLPVESICPTIAYWADEPGSCWPALQQGIRGQHLDAFLFWQGESDIENPHYAEQLSDLIRRVRAEVGNPNLLIVLMQYGRAYSGFPNGSEAASLAFVAQDPHAIYVLTHDLEWLPDNGHMTEAGYTAVAQRIVAMIRQKLR
jgi:hypothetical protein